MIVTQAIWKKGLEAVRNNTIDMFCVEDGEWFGDEQAVEFAQALKGNTSLFEIGLYKTKIGNVGIWAISKALETSTMLVGISIEGLYDRDSKAKLHEGMFRSKSKNICAPSDASPEFQQMYEGNYKDAILLWRKMRYHPDNITATDIRKIVARRGMIRSYAVESDRWTTSAFYELLKKITGFEQTIRPIESVEPVAQPQIAPEPEYVPPPSKISPHTIREQLLKRRGTRLGFIGDLIGVER